MNRVSIIIPAFNEEGEEGRFGKAILIGNNGVKL